MDAVFGRELAQRADCAEYRLSVLFVSAPCGGQQRHGTLRHEAGRIGVANTPLGIARRTVHRLDRRDDPRGVDPLGSGCGQQRGVAQQRLVGDEPHPEQLRKIRDMSQQGEGRLGGQFESTKPAAQKANSSGVTRSGSARCSAASRSSRTSCSHRYRAKS